MTQLSERYVYWFVKPIVCFSVRAVVNRPAVTVRPKIRAEKFQILKLAKEKKH